MKNPTLLILACLLLTSCRLAPRPTETPLATPEGGATSPADSTPGATPASLPPIFDIRYSDESANDPKSLSLDLYRIDQENAPVMIFVHGGAWRRGNKSNVDAKPAGFNGQGFIFVSVNYRLIPEVDVTQEVWDVTRAIAWVHDNIAAYGGDPDKIFLLGHSAGAHLVSLIGTDESYLEAEGMSLSDLKGVIALDTQAYDLTTVMPNLQYKDRGVYPNTFGNDPEFWKAMSPQLFLAPDKNIPPFIVAYTGKQPTRTDYSINFHAALQDNGIPALLIPAMDKSHGEINDELGLPDDPVTQTIFEWLKEILGGL
ncbi:MAG: alpha/beta hydrolase [Chloroflexota bacterium]